MSTTYKTPMLQQYQSLKEQYPDCLLFFRLGDFYELFGDDAKIGSEVLHLTLTSRNKGSDGRIPMCGVPFHASENYVARLVKAGYKVAICEQMTAAGKGLVEREVIRVVTAGTLLRDEALTEAGSQFILTLVIEPKLVAGAAADLSTGQFMAFSFPGPPEQIIPLLLSHFSPREVVIPRAVYDNSDYTSLLRRERNVNITCAHDWLIYIKDAETILKNHFHVESLDSFGLTKKPEAIKGAAALLGYLKYTQKGNVEHITSISEFHLSGHLVLDPITLRHLEVIRTAEGTTDGSLFGTINKTVTASGQRLLQDWLLHPVTKKKEIELRHQAITELVSRNELVAKSREELAHLSDVERLVARLSVGLGSPRDLRRLADTLSHYKDRVLPLFSGVKSRRLQDMTTPIHPDLMSWITQAQAILFEEAKPTLDEGYIFKEGFNEELDTLRLLTSGNRSWLADFEAQERRRTGIPKLKVVFSRAFGYAIEITNSFKDKAPPDYVPRQTLVNAGRYTCQSLVEYERKALSAMDTMIALEKTLFAEEVEKVVQLSQKISDTAYAIASLDVLTNFAHIASLYKYSKPNITERVGIEITAGRHPVIEQLHHESFVANDTELKPNKSFQLITGPNMAGKSTYIRQVALIVLLAHTGCFVPAESAEIGITDRIFTRIGAHDNLREAQSTFMVEMLETAHILHNATERSLVILDEVGRGTSPEDGFSLAWAIAESLASDNRGLILFATHFHDLKDIANTHSRVFNSHLAVAVDNEDLIFLRKVTDGPAVDSYGIVVAEKAGIPKAIIARAKELSYGSSSPTEQIPEMSLRGTKSRGNPDRDAPLAMTNQMALLSVEQKPSEIEAKLKQLNLNNMTPIEALNILNELQKNLR